MPAKDPNDPTSTYSSFLGTGWSFPPQFTQGGRDVAMTSDEDGIRNSLAILFGTARGERFLIPRYGLEPHDLLFEPASTTMKAFLEDRITTAILIQESRIRVLGLDVVMLDPDAGVLQIALDYEVRATNSRYNLVFPFYRHDSSEVLGTIAGSRPPG